MKSRSHRTAVLLGLLAALAAGQEPGPEPSEPGVGAFTLNEGGRLDFQARDLEVVEALAQLRQLLQRNIVVAPQVTERFTGDLYGVTLEQALDAICRSTGLVYRVEEAFIYVGPAEVETRLFRLSYVRAQDLQPLVQSLLSSRGKLVATAKADSGIAPNETNAGGDAYAASDVLLVSDLPANLERIARAVRELDVRPVQVRIEATILSADLENDRAVGIDLNVLTGIDFEDVNALSSGGDIELGDIPPGLLNREISSTGTALLDAFPQGGLTVGLIKNSVSLFIRALQERTNVRVLANPSVMVLNKQRGQVVVGRRDGYLTTTVTETSSTQSIEFLETGTRLLFRPFVGHDGFIRLEIHPEDSDGGVTASGLPFKETAEVTTNILARDGETIVIGGLFRERTVRTQKKVPGVDRVPLLGPALRSNQEEVRREELIILLTPHVVTHDDEAEAAAGPDEVLERQITEGGERLARSYVATALSLLAEGNRASASRLLSAARAMRPELVAVEKLRRSLRREETRRVADPRVTNRVLVRTLHGAEER